MFVDFDVSCTGLVSEDQFHRVLHTIGLADIVSHDELDAIMKRFCVSFQNEYKSKQFSIISCENESGHSRREAGH